MKSVKYIIVLVSNAFLLGFVMYLTRDPLERWLMDWFWAETIVDVLFQTMFAGFILGAWLFVKHYLHWEFSVAKRIGIAIGLVLLVNGHAYWKCVNEWYHCDPYPDRAAMIAKIYRFGYGTEGRNLTVDEYALIARRYDWGEIPSSARSIYFTSNGTDRSLPYPMSLYFVVPKGTKIKKPQDEQSWQNGLVQDVEDRGDSIVVKYYYNEH